MTGSTDVAQWPYGDVARQAPGKIEAEDYDGGGQNYAYYDTSAGNSGGAYRDDDVDIMAATDGGQSGYGVWAAVGEWMEYTVDVAQGEYVAHMRVASYTGGQTVRLLMDGQELGSVTVPATGGISTFQTVATTPFALAPGQGRVLRVVFDGGGVMWNWVELTPTDACAFAKAQPGWTPLSGDANEDCVVDALDLAILLAGWPGTYDLVDFAALAKTWLEENAWQ